MSKSLSRIRSLVSEIEEIQRQGQQGGKSVLERTAPMKSESPKAASAGTPERGFPVSDAPTPENAAQDVSLPSSELEMKTTLAVSPHSEPVLETPLLAEEEDPFADLADVVDLDTKRPEEKPRNSSGKVHLQLSGEVLLSLQIADWNETVELSQVGQVIEIRFADGKAFHIPFKAMA